MARRSPATRGRAAVSSGAMEGLLTATKMFLQLVMEQLCGSLAVLSEGLRQGPSLLRFPWEILVCATMIVFRAKSQHTLRKEKELAKRFSALVKEY